MSSSLVPAIVNAGTLLEETTGFGRYLLVFVLAMIPAIEPFVVIPVAIGLGLDPLGTGVAAFAGSATAMAAIAIFQQRVIGWWHRRRTRTRGEDSVPMNSSTRYRRARRAWDRYGLPGLALVGPILVGIHLTILFALLVDDRPRTTVGWLTVGLGAWTIVLVSASAYGFSLLGIS